MPFALVFNRNRQTALEESPAFAHVAERFRRAGELQRAISLCRDGLRRFPDHVSARVTLGLALVDLGKHADARKELKQALKLAPDNLAAIRGMAHLHDHGESFHGEHDHSDQVSMGNFASEPVIDPAPARALTPEPAPDLTFPPEPAPAPEFVSEPLLESLLQEEAMLAVEDMPAAEPANVVEASLSVESMFEMEAALEKEAALEMEALLAMEPARMTEPTLALEPAPDEASPVAMDLESLLDGPLGLDELDPLVPTPFATQAEQLEHVDLLDAVLELEAGHRGPDDLGPGDIDPVVRAYREALPIGSFSHQLDAMSIGLDLDMESRQPESLPPYDIHALERFLNQVQTRRMLNA